MALNLTIKEAKAEDLKKKGGRKADDSYAPLLKSFAAGKVDQIELEGVPQDEKEISKLLVALKTTRTRHELPVNVISRMGDNKEVRVFLSKKTK